MNLVPQPWRASSGVRSGFALPFPYMRAFILAIVTASGPDPSAGQMCPGDCGGDGVVTVDEVVTLVRLTLSGENARTCAAGDTDGNARITVEEVVRAVRALLEGCQPANRFTPTVTPTPTPTAVPTMTPSPTASLSQRTVVFLGPCSPPAAPGQTLVADISTGQSVALAGSPDPFWRFAPPVPASGPIPFTTTPFSAWVAPPAGSLWIQPDSSGSPAPGPSAVYSVQVFIWPPLSGYSALRLVGQYAADNIVQSISVNNVGIASCTPANSNCFASLHALNLTAAPPSSGPFVAGLNTLQFRVGNISNVTGLLVNARLEADCPPPTPTPTTPPTASPTRTRVPTGTRSPTPTRLATRRPTPSRSATATVTATPSPASTRTPTSSPTFTLRPTSTPSSSATPSCVGVPTGVVAWWPLDDPSGANTVVDLGGLGLHGQPQPGSVNNTFTNGPVTVPGQVGTALYFYSGAEFAEVPHSSSLDLSQSDLTIDAWFAALLPGAPGFGRIPNWAPGQAEFFAIVDKTDAAANTGYGLFVRSLATAAPQPPPHGFPVNVFVDLCFQQGNSGSCALLYSGTALYDAASASYLPPVPPWPFTGQWLHFAVTVDRTSGVGQWFLNGNVLGSFAAGPGVANNSLPLWIGKSRLASSGFEFSLDEIEVFDRALTLPEIASVAGLGGKCKTPRPTTPSASRSPTRTATRSASATLPPATHTPTRTTTVEGDCRFVGPRMCGGTCPDPSEVCIPKADDSGCHCVPREPTSPTPTHTLPCPGAVCTVTPSPTATPTLARSPTRTGTPTSAASPTPTATRTPCFAEVCVSKFWDLDANGQNDHEPGLGGWSIQFLDSNGQVVASVVTGVGGTMCTGVVAPAAYTVQEVAQGGCVQTYPPPPGTHAIFLECGQLANLAFGNRCPFPTLTGTPTRSVTPTPTSTQVPTAVATATPTRTRTPTSRVPPID